MPDEIQPALSPEQWRTMYLPLGNPDIPPIAVSLCRHADGSTALSIEADDTFYNVDATPGEAVGIIALANAALPDDDPRKITRAKVRALDAIISVSEDHWDEGPSDEGWQSDELSDSVAMARQLRDAIAALLPPEPL